MWAREAEKEGLGVLNDWNSVKRSVIMIKSWSTHPYSEGKNGDRDLFQANDYGWVTYLWWDFAQGSWKKLRSGTILWILQSYSLKEGDCTLNIVSDWTGEWNYWSYTLRSLNWRSPIWRPRPCMRATTTSFRSWGSDSSEGSELEVDQKSRLHITQRAIHILNEGSPLVAFWEPDTVFGESNKETICVQRIYAKFTWRYWICWRRGFHSEIESWDGQNLSSGNIRFLSRNVSLSKQERIEPHFLDSGTRPPFSSRASQNLSSAHFSFNSTLPSLFVSWRPAAPVSQPTSPMIMLAATLASAIHRSTSLIRVLISCLYRVLRDASRVIIFETDLYCFNKGSRGRKRGKLRWGTEAGLIVGRK